MKLPRLLAVWFVILGTSFFWSPSAIATAPELMVRNVSIVCANSAGETYTANTGWNADNTFFQGKGDIARLFCEGGFIGQWTTYISDNYTGIGRYYNGIAPTVSPSPEPTPSPEQTVAPSDSSTVTSDSQTVVSETSTAVSDSQTVVLAPSESQTSTSESSTQTSQQETSTNIIVPSEPTPSEPAPSIPAPPPAVEPEPAPQPTPQPEPVPAPEPLPEAPEPVEEAPAPEPEPDVAPEPVPVEEVAPELQPEPPLEEEPALEPAPEPEPIPEPAPEPLIDIAPEPPVAAPDATDEEKEIVAEALIEQAQGKPVTAQAIAEAGLTYADLPPSTPVEVRQDEDGNEVVITAEIAAALVVLENPAALVQAIFTDPGQALLAIASIGADMSDEERTESEKIIVASVIAGQAAVTAASAAGAAAAYRRKP